MTKTNLREVAHRWSQRNHIKKTFRYGWCPLCNSSPPRESCPVCHGDVGYGPQARYLTRGLWIDRYLIHTAKHVTQENHDD